MNPSITRNREVMGNLDTINGTGSLARPMIIAMIAFALIAGRAPGAEENPEAIFETLFGQQFRAALSTGGSDDNIELAEQILAVVPSLESTPDVQRRACEKVFRLTSEVPEAVDLSIAAMEQLSALSPDDAIYCHDRVVKVLAVAHAHARGEQRSELVARLALALEKAGDMRADGDESGESVRLYQRAKFLARSNGEIDAVRLSIKLEAARNRALTFRRIEQLKGRIERNPNDLEAGKALVMAYLVELDRPESAARYTFLVEDLLGERILNATKDPEELKASDWIDLAEWYEGLSHGQAKWIRARVLARAADYYQRYLASGPEASSRLVVARVKLARIRVELAGSRNEAAPAEGGKWNSFMSDPNRLVGWKSNSEAPTYEYKKGALLMGRGSLLTRPLAYKDFAVRGSIRLAERGAARIGVRGTAFSHYQVIIRPGVIRLVSYSKAQLSDLATAKLDVAPGGSLSFELIAAGDRLIVRVNEQTLIDATDDEHPGPGVFVLFARGTESGWSIKGLQARELSSADVKALSTRE